MHLFAGVGGGLLTDLILGHSPIVAVEWEPYACKVLRQRAAEGWFPSLSVWEGDVRLFDPSEYAGQVDCIHAGFPCQDISVAGKQAGVSEGTRSGLYREVLRIAGMVRPKQLFLENVSAILSNGLGAVLADLAALGYDTRGLCIRASDVGAPHHRDRWFLLSNANNKGSPCTGAKRASEWSHGATFDIDSENMADTTNAGLSQRGFTGQPTGNPQGCTGLEREPERCGEDVADTQRDGLQGERGYGDSAGSAGLCSGAWGNEKQGISAEYNWWSAEPELGRVANGIPNRVGQLKGYGNAQVPLQAAAAYRLLGGM